MKALIPLQLQRKKAKKKMKIIIIMLIHNALPARGQFHHHSTSSFYTHRSQKHKKDCQVKQLDCAFGREKAACRTLVKLTQGYHIVTDKYKYKELDLAFYFPCFLFAFKIACRKKGRYFCKAGKIFLLNILV